MADMLLTGAPSEAIKTEFETEMHNAGAAFCQVVEAVKQAGLTERAEAEAMLARYRLGVDVVFELADRVPVVSTVKGALNQIPGGVASDYENKLKDGLAASLSGINTAEVVARTKADATGALTQVDRMVVENMMSAIARRPQAMYDLGMTTWGSWPPFMLKEPTPPPDMPVLPPLDPNLPSAGLPDSLRSHLKPEFLDQRGGVKVPLPGSENYDDFQQWYLFDPEADNRLYERAMVLTETARNDMNGCMARIQFEGSL
jgi:hypothetical protein